MYQLTCHLIPFPLLSFLYVECVCVRLRALFSHGGRVLFSGLFFFFRTIFKVVVPRKYRVDHSCWKHGRKGAVNKGKRNEGERLFEKKKKKSRSTWLFMKVWGQWDQNYLQVIFKMSPPHLFIRESRPR